MAGRRCALLVTYTMTDPYAVGVFFRALRIVEELQRRGWRCLVVNHGRIPDDPKVRRTRRHCEIVEIESEGAVKDFRRVAPLFRDLAPDVVLFGEYPMPFFQPFFDASRALVVPPLVVVDQYYDPASGARLRGVDLFLMYGLRSLWPEHPARHPTFRIVPPFIDRVAPLAELPVPDRFHALPWLTVLGFDRRVMEAGLATLARLREVEVLGITLSHDPIRAEELMDQAGVPRRRRLALPLQEDETLFGLIAASRAVVVANGFMQMAEAVALGCPAVCVNRGIGMEGHTLHPAFRPFVSFDDDLEPRVGRVAAWLRASPFTEEQLAALRLERGGAKVTVDYLESAATRPRWRARLERCAGRWRASRYDDDVV